MGLAEPPDTDLQDMVMENTKYAVRNTRLRLTRSPSSPSLLKSLALSPTLPPSRSVSPRPSRSPRSSARTSSRTSASMLPSLLMLPTLLTRRKLSLASPAARMPPSPSPHKLAQRTTAIMANSSLRCHTIKYLELENDRALHMLTQSKKHIFSTSLHNAILKA